MAITCNIDRRGKRVRAVSGTVCIAAAIALAVILWPLDVWAGLSVAGLALLGAFQIVEATLGWCAVRAMGFRTPL